VRYQALFATTFVALCLSVGVACDETVQATQDVAVPAEATLALSGKVDLQALVDAVASGEVEDAAALEKRLASDTIARIDLDEDGKRDEVRIVERRVGERTDFEIRAVPSSQAEIDVALAPRVATLTLEPMPEAGHAIARASYSPSFAATAKLDADATVEHTFIGLGIETNGRLRVDASANAFVGWTFRVGRPVYIAEVFIVAHEVPARDPCWPPGHCKHGHWKAQRNDHLDGTLVRVSVDGDHRGHKVEHKKHKAKHKQHKGKHKKHK
jgi:hypothetical protein